MSQGPKVIDPDDAEEADVEVEHEGSLFTGKESAVRAAIASFTEQRAREAATKQQFPGTKEQKMTTLCRLFPSLRNAKGVEPWDSQTFVLWLLQTGGGSGLMHAARFVLNVWNSTSNWPELLQDELDREQPDPSDRRLWDGLQRLRETIDERGEGDARDTLLKWFADLGPVNVVDAFATWDERHREAFRTWANHPFFP